MKKFLITGLLCVALMATMLPTAFAASDANYTACMTAISEQKEVQNQAHQTAELLRKQGYSDSSTYIQAAKSAWNEAQSTIKAYQKLSKYTDEDIRILATTVYYEAGTTTDQLRQYVAQVVMNRVADSRFPNTVKGVVTQAGQYAGNYATTSATQAIKNKDSQNGTYYYATCETAAKAAMMGQVDMPSSVIYQANFSQGKGVWKSVYYNSGWFASTSYFCYG
jgi:spore germination cell wall hydrolase CwlJ-like protein